MGEWWKGLSDVNQYFFGAAAFFSVFFLWQLASAFHGLAGGADTDAGGHDADAGAHHGGGEVDAAAMVAFKLLSVRSVIAFFTLFTWAGALYLSQGMALAPALGWAVLWGLAAMIVVALIFHWMRRLTETGTGRLSTCVGTEGVVSLDIPAGGQGEARVTVSGVVSRVKARARGGVAVKAGALVKVLSTLDPTTVEVAPSGAAEQKTE